MHTQFNSSKEQTADRPGAYSFFLPSIHRQLKLRTVIPTFNGVANTGSIASRASFPYRLMYRYMIAKISRKARDPNRNWHDLTSSNAWVAVYIFLLHWSKRHSRGWSVKNLMRPRLLGHRRSSSFADESEARKAMPILKVKYKVVRGSPRAIVLSRPFRSTSSSSISPGFFQYHNNNGFTPRVSGVTSWLLVRFQAAHFSSEGVSSRLSSESDWPLTPELEGAWEWNKIRHFDRLPPSRLAACSRAEKKSI